MVLLIEADSIPVRRVLGKRSALDKKRLIKSLSDDQQRTYREAETVIVMFAGRHFILKGRAILFVTGWADGKFSSLFRKRASETVKR